MKNIFTSIVAIFLFLTISAQAPQKLSYQAVVRNSAGKLIQNANVGIRFSILQGSSAGSAVYTETHSAVTNVNGLVSAEIGAGISSGNFAAINWANGPYFLKTETDPSGGSNYTITGVSELLSVPYALNSLTVGTNGFSGDYNDLTNKPVIDGSETKIVAGTNVTVTGAGTQANPYTIKSSASSFTGGSTTLTTSQTWTVPTAVSKIKVELWGGAGGGGGAGAYSYSYNLLNGGDGGSAGFAAQVFNVTENQQFNVIVGAGGTAGTNASYSGAWYGDTNGGNGGDSWFGAVKAAGGTGGKKGSYTYYTIHGTAGTANVGEVTGYASNPQSSMLDNFIGLVRSYLSDRFYTSKPGIGGSLQSYSTGPYPATAGEGGAAVITFIE
ncbi:MAG: glycine-rich domain-containing protein [Bacteroidota bacterium]